MRFEHFAFLLYILIFLWQVPRLSFIKKSGLKIFETRLLILFKVLSGFLAAFYFKNVFTNSDYVIYNIEGMLEYKLLLSNPSLFFTDFKNDINLYGLDGLFNTSGSFWGYLRFHLLFKFIALLNLVTKGNFYLNSAIFSSFVFFGHIAFYRIYNEIYAGKKTAKLLTCFFLPSIALYTSCIHKDGLIFISLGIGSFIFFRLLQNLKNIDLKAFSLLALTLICIFLFRNYVLVALLPAMMVAFMVHRTKHRKTFLFIGMYISFAVIFFLSGLFNNSFNLPTAVIQRKADFSLLEKGSTNLEMGELQPTAASFVKNIPRAINHVMFRPYPFEFKETGVLLASLELYIYLLLIIAFLWMCLRKKQFIISIHPFNIYGLAFFITMLLIIGFTIPNVGAIIRYRSIIWIFLLCPLACNLNFPKKTSAN